MLVILIKRAKLASQIDGVVPHLVDDRLSILQYVDNTIIFLYHDLEKAKNLKILFCAFEKLSGLKINFHKSEMYYFEEAKELPDEYLTIFGCHSGFFPFKYLGISMNYRKLSNKDWKLVEERIEKRLSSWKGKYLLVGGRLVSINLMLMSLLLFTMSFFEVPRGVLEKIDFYRSIFYWQSDDHKKKYRLAKWNIICQPRDQEGLGIQNHLQPGCFWRDRMPKQFPVRQLTIQNAALVSPWSGYQGGHALLCPAVLGGIAAPPLDGVFAAAVIGGSCSLHFAEEHSRRRVSTNVFELAAWAADPVAIPLRVWLTVTDPDPSGKSSPQVVIHKQHPREPKRGMVYDVLIHLSSVEDSRRLGSNGRPLFYQLHFSLGVTNLITMSPLPLHRGKQSMMP
jgi:hypothetical protein